MVRLGTLFAVAGFAVSAALPACGARTQEPAPARVRQVKPELRADARPLFTIFYRAGRAWQPGKPMREQGLGPHAAYMKDLLERGTLVTAGPLLDIDGGLAIVRAADLEAAAALVAADPAVTSGIFEAEVHAWMPRFTTPEPLPSARP